MVPAAYVRLESLPLTPNGKLDRKALPAPEADAYALRGYEPPQGEMETKLAADLGRGAQVERVGRHDNFFALGGHSLLAVRVVTRLRQASERGGERSAICSRIRCWPIWPRVLESAAHCRTAAHRVSRNAASGCRCRLRSSGCGFWRRWRVSARPITFRSALRLKGDLDRAALRRALDRIVVRHEALRTTFVFIDGEPVQRIAAAEDSQLPSDRARSARAR